MSRIIEDPESSRWKRKHPRFPGVANCVELLRRRNVHGNKVDIICDALRDHAATHTAELITAFRDERDERLKHILLGIICEAKLPDALPVFVDHLQSEDETLRQWSVAGLHALDSPEARKALWQVGLATGGKSRSNKSREVDRQCPM
jgi:hypothetical protein